MEKKKRIEGVREKKRLNVGEERGRWEDENGKDGMIWVGDKKGMGQEVK